LTKLNTHIIIKTNFYENITGEMLRRGGVHNSQMPREKAAGGSLREGIMEVASEQWTEQEES
jgi:hypothetical protein